MLLVFNCSLVVQEINSFTFFWLQKLLQDCFYHLIFSLIKGTTSVCPYIVLGPVYKVVARVLVLGLPFLPCKRSARDNLPTQINFPLSCVTSNRTNLNGIIQFLSLIVNTWIITTVVKLTINFSVGQTPIVSRTEQNMTRTSFVHVINYNLYKP